MLLLVLEEQRPTKRQMTQLADAMQVISLRDREKQFQESQAAKKIDEKGTHEIAFQNRSTK